MFPRIQVFGIVVKLGQSQDTTFGPPLTLVVPQPKDTNLKEVDGESPRENQERSKTTMKDQVLYFDEFLFEEEKKSYKGSHGGLDKWFKEKWVDISKTNPDGSHPPCGRSDTSKGGYPKCRKVRVAAKMSKKQKRAAVARKRKAERTGSKGSGRKPNYSK